MAKTVTITDIEFDGARLWSEQDAGGATHIFISIGLWLIANGNKYHDEYVKELTGARKTTVVNFFANVKQDILIEKGIA